MAIVGYLALIVVTYLIGSIPWGVVLGRVFKGVDVRQHGSGATGATNALRVLGWKISLAVFVLDFFKGLIPVALARWLDCPGWVVGSVALISVIGHCWSPFIGFRGGKGMATGGGAAVALMPWLVFMLIPMSIVVAVTRYVSLASLTAAAIGSGLVVTLALWGSFPSWWAIGVVAVAAVIVIQHRSNINRLLKGTERKFGQNVAV
jgi:glycerol-3-phosphate acyltransferase PlsY